MFNATPPPEGTPQWDFDTVKWRFMSEYYDGPLSGVINVFSGEFIAGEPLYHVYWAECYQESEWDGDEEPAWYRRYKVWDLTAASWKEQQRRIDLFEEIVGSHWTWDEKGNRGSTKIKPGWHRFYDEAKKWKEWKPEGKIIGWFES